MDAYDLAKPLLFRLPAETAHGLFHARPRAVQRTPAEEDYLYTYERVADSGDYFVVNVSSPNTPGL